MPAENALNTGTNPSLFTYVSSQDDNGVGTIRWDANATKCYKWVKVVTTASQTAVAGDLVGYKALTGYALSTVSHDGSADCDAVPVPAGALVAALTAAQSTAGVYCWIQIKGACTLSIAVVNGVAGDEFLLSTTDKTGTLRLDASLAKACGISMNTTTGVILDCPF